MLPLAVERSALVLGGESHPQGDRDPHDYTYFTVFAEDEEHATALEDDFWQMLERANVMEIYSPPRLAAWAEKLGLRSGGSLDLSTGWDFDKKEDVSRMWELLESQDPDLVTTSPPCDPFSPIQALNRHKHTADSWRAMRERGLRHLRVCMKVCMHRYHRYMYFLHEHPAFARSWQEPVISDVVAHPDVSVVRADQCQYGLLIEDALGVAHAKKPTKFLSLIHI